MKYIGQHERKVLRRYRLGLSRARTEREKVALLRKAVAMAVREGVHHGFKKGLKSRKRS
ncbi:MAG: hypothetical protein V1787_05530 [Candidatus Micrarchaeota archaeon]